MDFIKKWSLWRVGNYILFFPLLCVLVFGCAGSQKKTEMIASGPDQAAMAISEENVSHEGSLWQSNGPLNELFMDIKARHVGDIVTISIVESASASNKATTDTDRKSSLSASVDNFLGMENRYLSTDKFNPFAKVKGSLESSFKGAGETTRSGKLAASITAKITERLPNGNFRIVGSREVTVNNEKQMIILSGIIRPRDISPDNVVLSTYISEAKITYTGQGIVNDRQRPGWMARVFDWVWPF
jgi:flagellar L-ring protein precursor FlgH